MPDDALHPALDLARHGNGNGDKFLGLWVALMVMARNGSDTRRTIVEFVSDRDVVAAVDAVGEGPVLEQLRDAAAVYFTTCLTDPQYSSTMFGMKRLSVDQIHAKAADEAAHTLRMMLDSQALDGVAAGLPDALVGGFLDALAPQGEQPLRAALAKHPALAHLSPPA